MKLKPEKKSGLNQGFEPKVVCMVFHIFTCTDHHLLPWVPEVFFLIGGDRNERRRREGESRSGEKKNITNSQNDKLLDGLMAQLVEDCIGIAQVKI